MSAVLIEKEWEFKNAQSITIQGRKYDVHEAIRLAADLPVMHIPMDHINISLVSPCESTMRSFVAHMLMVNAADTDEPILMNENGAIIDGRHRLAKHLMFGHSTVKARRFVTDPPSCYTDEE